jgi:hypothetical protein
VGSAALGNDVASNVMIIAKQGIQYLITQPQKQDQSARLSRYKFLDSDEPFPFLQSRADQLQLPFRRINSVFDLA